MNCTKVCHLNSKNIHQAGVALTEMAIVLPLIMTIVMAAFKLSSQFQSGIKQDLLKMDAALSMEQLPRALRVASGWPESRKSKASLPTQLNPELGVFSTAIEQWLCAHAAQIPRVGAPPLANINGSSLYPLLRASHLRALSVQRAACLAEGIRRWGPQAATVALLSASALPQESARKLGILSLCPGVAKAGQFARQRVIFKELKGQFSGLIPAGKDVSFTRGFCRQTQKTCAGLTSLSCLY